MVDDPYDSNDPNMRPEVAITLATLCIFGLMAESTALSYAKKEALIQIMGSLDRTMAPQQQLSNIEKLLKFASDLVEMGRLDAEVSATAQSATDAEREFALGTLSIVPMAEPVWTDAERTIFSRFARLMRLEQESKARVIGEINEKLRSASSNGEQRYEPLPLN